LSEIIAYPGFNLEDIPPEFDNVVSKVVELVYERSRRLYGEPASRCNTTFREPMEGASLKS